MYFPRRDKPLAKFFKRFAIAATVAGVIFLMCWQLAPKSEKVQKNLENLNPVSVDSVK